MNRFWNNVAKQPKGCWEWTGHKRVRGYGGFRYKGKMELTHRVSYLLNKGEIPGGYHVCHTCDNPSCVNPKHLFLGTHADNMRDKISKGRGYNPSGQSHGMSKLTNSDVTEIKRLLAIGVSQPKIAKQFKVHRKTICRINTGKSWKIHNDKKFKR